MSLTYSHGREFVHEIRPILERQDLDQLSRHLSQRWPNSRLLQILECGHDDAAQVALACLSLTGRMIDTPAIAPHLADDDPFRSAIAEHAMWCIWFRSGDAGVDVALTRAVQLIAADHFDAAIASLDALIDRAPGFAEAYNQRAIAWFLKEDYARSLADCEIALRLNPWHFGALAGVGHCYASLGRLDRALQAYRAALRLHPRLEGIRQSIRQIRCSLETTAPAEPDFLPSPDPADLPRRS